MKVKAEHQDVILISWKSTVMAIQKRKKDHGIQNFVLSAII
jgi:hypothetical protein